MLFRFENFDPLRPVWFHRFSKINFNTYYSYHILYIVITIRILVAEQRTDKWCSKHCNDVGSGLTLDSLIIYDLPYNRFDNYWVLLNKMVVQNCDIKNFIKCFY